MTVALKNRQSQIPNGLKFQIKEVGFVAAPYQSFDALVNQVLAVVQANAPFARKYRWPLDREGVAKWVDYSNAVLCKQNGWTDYIVEMTDADPPKFSPPPGAHPAGAVAAGAKSLGEWFGEGMKPVAIELAEKRAEICAYCPQNRPGDLGNWFSRQVSELIRDKIGHFKKLNLVTSRDKDLGVCDACACPMKLKVHVPLPHILNHMLPESKVALDPQCWIIAEEKK